jgi:acyl carrier protein
MDSTQILTVVRETIGVVVGVPADEVGADIGLAAEYDLDSLELMEIGTRLESALDVRIEPAELKNAATAADVSAYLQRRLGSA